MSVHEEELRDCLLRLAESSEVLTKSEVEAAARRAHHALGLLLEEHRTSLAEERTRYANVIARLSEEVDRFTGKKCGRDFLAVLGGVEQVAVRARNEGLERAAAEVARWSGVPARVANTTGHIADSIRAMKESQE